MMGSLKKQMEGTVTLRRSYGIVAFLVFAGLTALTVYHVNQLGMTNWRIPIIMISFVWLVLIIVAAHANRPATNNPPKSADGMTAAVITVFNEDPVTFRKMLDTLDIQRFRLKTVIVVNDGSYTTTVEIDDRYPEGHPRREVEVQHKDDSLREIFEDWKRQTRIRDAVYHYQPNAGKRHAQKWAFDLLRGRSIAEVPNYIVTIDSDTILDQNAIYNGLRPFDDDKVMSVAGLLVGLNASENLLTRAINLGFESSFMNGRAAWSTFKSVAVNCGGLAIYRSNVVFTHLHEYTNQTVWGRPANSGDDRIMTAFAAMHGKTVFQEDCVGYTLLPNNRKHLTKQRCRWWRSFWWGGVWLLKRLPITRMIWWLVLSQYVTFVLYSVVFPTVLIIDPIIHQKLPWEFFVYVFFLSYLRTARTLQIKRPDVSTGTQILTYLWGSPANTLINLWLCTALQWYGLFTFGNTGWSTRGQGAEVGVAGGNTDGDTVVQRRRTP